MDTTTTTTSTKNSQLEGANPQTEEATINEYGYKVFNYEPYYKDSNFVLVGWIWTHVSLRRVYRLVLNKLKTFRPKNRDEIDKVIKAINTIRKFLHDHHIHEDELFFIWLKSMKPETVQILDLLESQHTEWDHLDEKLKQDIKTLEENKEITNHSSPGFPELLESIRSNIDQQTTHIHNHLYDEERLLLPLIATIPKAEQEKMGKQIHDRVRSESNARFVFCAMVDATKYDKPTKESFENTMPLLLRKLLPALFNKKEYKWFLDVCQTD
eukprot:gene5705-7099_t